MTLSLSQVVSVALVLAVVYYIMSMLISSLTKWFLDLIETRGKILEDFLKNSLVNAIKKGMEDNKDELLKLEQEGNKKLEQLKNTPQINALRPVRAPLGVLGGVKISEHVERIQPKVLVDALFDVEGTVAGWQEKVKKVINMLPDNFTNLSGNPTPFKTKASLIKMVDENYYTFDQWRDKLETYFGSVMDQAAQKFKLVAKRWVLLFSVILAFALGVDSIQIAGRAWYDPQLTQKADAYAETILQSDDATQKDQQDDLKVLYDTLDDMKVINLPWYVFIQPPLETDSQYQDLVSPYTEWSLSQPYGLWLFLRIFGILITGIAVSQGSAFWYDIIRQLKGEQKKTEEAAKETTGGGGGTEPGLGVGRGEPPAGSDSEPPRE